MALLKKFSSYIFIAFCLSAPCYSQDHMIAKFNANPVSFNAAQTGAFDGSMRAGLQFIEINSVVSTYTNYKISYDQPVGIRQIKFGAGLFVSHDEIGQSYFNVDQISASLSYNILSFKQTAIRIGVQPGVLIYNSNLQNETWPDQYNRLSGRYDPNLETLEFYNPNFSSFNLNAGILVSTYFSNMATEFGLSVKGLTATKLKFYNYGDKLEPVFLMHGSVQFKLFERMNMKPAMIIKEMDGQRLFNVGSFVFYNFTSNYKEKGIYAGLFFNANNFETTSLFLTAGLIYNNWDVSLGYNVYNGIKNDLVAINGPFEIALIYTGLTSKLLRYTLPCTRF